MEEEWKGGSEGGYYKLREECAERGRKGISKGGRRVGGREREVITKEGREEGRDGITKGGIDGWKDEDRDGMYYKGSGEAGRILQLA